MTDVGYDIYGRLVAHGDTEGMSFPVRCRWCGHVHDAARVTIVQRYSDCSTWLCPNCRALIDDRPQAWGGSAIPLAGEGI